MKPDVFFKKAHVFKNYGNKRVLCAIIKWLVQRNKRGKSTAMNRAAYRIIKFLIKTFTVKPKMYGLNHIAENEPALFMASHARFYGPISVSCFFKPADRIWANSMVIETKESMEYTTRTLFRETLGWRKFPAKIAGGFVGWVMAGLMQNEKLVTIYWDAARARQTIVAGVNVVLAGESQLMFARESKDIDGRLDEDFDFDKGYQLVIRQAYKKYGVNPILYPVAINKLKRTMAVGPPTAYDPKKPFLEEKKRINHYLVSAVKMGYYAPERLAEISSPDEI